MRTSIILGLFLLCAATGSAQETEAARDTTLLINGRKIIISEQADEIKVKLYEVASFGDTIANDQIFEGIYKNGQSTERRILFSYPFSRRYPRRYIAGAYLGLNRLANADGMKYRQGRSWEVGANVFEVANRLGKNRHWVFAIGGGLKANYYGYNGNAALQEDADDISRWQPAPEGYAYKRSCFARSSVVIPVIVDWQAHPEKIESFFVQAGFEAETSFCMTEVKYKEGDGEENLRYKYFAPTGINILIRAGFKDVGIYGRCSCTPLFEKGKGPQAYPYSIGVFFNL